MVPSARRPLRVRHWDGYAQMSKNQKNTSPFADSKGPMPTNPTPIAPLPAIRLHQMLCPTQHAYLRTRPDAPMTMRSRFTGSIPEPAPGGCDLRGDCATDVVPQWREEMQRVNPT